ncbi:MAG: hypothetical protein ACYDBB_06590 [Armatimonadota bacterium]
MTDQFIPATRTPVMVVPIWVLYVGPLVCLIIAAIMLWRCHAAGNCPLQRHGGYKSLEKL